MSVESILTLVTIIGGIPTIVGVLIHIGRKLQVLDGVQEDIGKVRKTVGTLAERFVKLETRVDERWKDNIAPSHSPRQLNERGLNILNQSGIKQIVEEKKQTLLDAVKATNPTNAYDAEQAALDVVSELPKHCPDVIPQLKDGAFKAGQGIETVLLVGGFYLRDLIFPELGYSTTELDKPKKD